MDAGEDVRRREVHPRLRLSFPGLDTNAAQAFEAGAVIARRRRKRAPEARSPLGALGSQGEQEDRRRFHVRGLRLRPGRTPRPYYLAPIATSPELEVVPTRPQTTDDSAESTKSAGPASRNSVRLGSSPRAPRRVGGLRAVGRGSGGRASSASLLPFSPGGRSRLNYSARRIARYTASQCEATSSRARAVVSAAASRRLMTASTSVKRDSRARTPLPRLSSSCARTSVSLLSLIVAGRV